LRLEILYHFRNQWNHLVVSIAYLRGFIGTWPPIKVLKRTKIFKVTLQWLFPMTNQAHSTNFTFGFYSRWSNLLLHPILLLRTFSSCASRFLWAKLIRKLKPEGIPAYSLYPLHQQVSHPWIYKLTFNWQIGKE